MAVFSSSGYGVQLLLKQKKDTQKSPITVIILLTLNHTMMGDTMLVLLYIEDQCFLFRLAIFVGLPLAVLTMSIQ